MKKIVVLFAFIWFPLIAYGQACGTYGVKYKGRVTSKDYQIDSIALPRTAYLHRCESDTSHRAFINVKLVDNVFNIQIKSHLTTPYYDKNDLIDFYKTKSSTFNLKIFLSHEGKTETKLIKIPWESITVAEIEDKGFGQLFEFDFKEIIF